MYLQIIEAKIARIGKGLIGTKKAIETKVVKTATAKRIIGI